MNNEVQEYTFTEAAKLFKMRTSDFIKEYIASGKIPFIQRNSSKHIVHRDLIQIQEQEKLRY